MSEALFESHLPGLELLSRGKVRDIYAHDDALVLVATDRISAFDHVLSPGIAGRGVILTQLSNFWFERLAGICPHHLLATAPRSCYVADDHGRVVAFGIISRREQDAFLSFLFVEPSWQGRQLGRSVLHACIDGAGSGIARISTCAEANQPVSTGLYAKLGLAVLLHEGSTVVVVLNSLRLLAYRAKS